MALPPLRGEIEEVLLEDRDKDHKKQLAECQSDQCQQICRDTRGLLLFLVAGVDEQGRRGPNHQHHTGDGRAGVRWNGRDMVLSGNMIIKFAVIFRVACSEMRLLVKFPV